MHKTALLLCALPVAAGLAGCRGEISKQPPIHIVPNMDWQDKLKAQSESKFAGWKDGRGMRMPVAGTVPHDVDAPNRQRTLREQSKDPEVVKLYTYQNKDKSYVDNPLPATAEILARGQERYHINCAVCHGRNGRGVGIVGRKLPVRPPNLVKPASAKDDHPLTRNEWDRVKAFKDGYLYEVITNGKGTMQPYKYQVDVRDRWAIVHYIRALQFRAAN